MVPWYSNFFQNGWSVSSFGVEGFWGTQSQVLNGIKKIDSLRVCGRAYSATKLVTVSIFMEEC